MGTGFLDLRIIDAIRSARRVRVSTENANMSETIEGVALHVLDHDAICSARRPWSNTDCLIVRDGSHEYGVPLDHIVTIEIVAVDARGRVE